MNEPIEEDFVMPKMRACDLCVHSPVCGAYKEIQKNIEKFETQFQYVEFPAKARALAVMCKEYKEKAEGEILSDYKSMGGCCG